jgi:hypothetical protein
VKYSIEISDPNNLLKLSDRDKKILSTFIPDQCLCTRGILDKIFFIKIVDEHDDDPNYVRWAGNWHPVTVTRNGEETFVGAQIILNVHYANDNDKVSRLDSLAEALSHEYSHHWTMCYAYEYLDNPFSTRYLLPYYRARNIGRSALIKYVDANDSYENYLRCDKEVVAEDFKYFFTPFRSNHLMADIEEIGLPNQRVEYFLSRMIHPNLF